MNRKPNPSYYNKLLSFSKQGTSFHPYERNTREKEDVPLVPLRSGDHYTLPGTPGVESPSDSTGQTKNVDESTFYFSGNRTEGTPKERTCGCRSIWCTRSGPTWWCGVRRRPTPVRHDTLVGGWSAGGGNRPDSNPCFLLSHGKSHTDHEKGVE